MTSKTPAPQTDKAGRTRRDEILDVAAGLFARQGYSATTMQAVADEVGILKGSLYHHFASKEQILFEITRAPLAALVEQAEQISDSKAGAPEKLQVLISHHIRALDKSYPHLGVITAERDDSLPAAMREEIVGLRRRYQKVIEKIYRQGIRRGELTAVESPTIIVNFVLGAVNWMHRWYRPGGEQPPERIAEMLSYTILHGLLPDDARELFKLEGAGA